MNTRAPMKEDCCETCENWEHRAANKAGSRVSGGKGHVAFPVRTKELASGVWLQREGVMSPALIDLHVGTTLSRHVNNSEPPLRNNNTLKWINEKNYASEDATNDKVTLSPRLNPTTIIV